MKPWANTGCSTEKPAAVPTYMATELGPCVSMMARIFAPISAFAVCPGDGLEGPIGPAPHGVQQAVRGVEQLMLAQPLGTGKAAGRHVLAIGLDAQHLVVLDLHFEPAKGLADAAEGVFGAGICSHGRYPNPSARRPRGRFDTSLRAGENAPPSRSVAR